MQEDEALLLAFVGQPNRMFNAAFVRLCEKRLLKRAIENAEAMVAEEMMLSRPRRKRGRDGEKDSLRVQKKVRR